MIIELSEVNELDHLLHLGGPGGNMFERQSIFRYLCTHPHLLLPMGFDECRVFKTGENLRGTVVESLFPSQEGGKYSGEKFSFGYEAIYRHHSTGEWHLLWFVNNAYRIILLGDQQKKLLISPTEIISTLNGHIKEPLNQPSSILLPTLWHPVHFTSNQILVNEVNRDLLIALSNEKISLDQIHWRKLEEIIAELLMSKGLKVSLTKMTRDGGRDMVAEGELIPGIWCTMAVEVKHKKTVGIQDLGQFIYRNMDYPLLLLATSGTFSSGVLSEISRESNRLRLILRDRVGIQNWINQYAQSKGFN